MKTVLMASLAVAFSATALAQTTIYKHVDDNGRVTYSNKPIKGATVVDLEPLTTIPTPPAVIATAKASNFTISTDKGSPPIEKASLVVDKAAKPVAVVTPVGPMTNLASIASIDTQVQKKRDNDRRRILEQELTQEEETLVTVRGSILQEQQNPVLVAAVRTAQQATDPTPSQLLEMRNALDKASGRIRGLQATAAEHEKNIEALKKELGALKP
jgi:uncharacterized protein DUF4124